MVPTWMIRHGSYPRDTIPRSYPVWILINGTNTPIFEDASARFGRGILSILVRSHFTNGI